MCTSQITWRQLAIVSNQSLDQLVVRSFCGSLYFFSLHLVLIAGVQPVFSNGLLSQIPHCSSASQTCAKQPPSHPPLLLWYQFSVHFFPKSFQGVPGISTLVSIMSGSIVNRPFPCRPVSVLVPILCPDMKSFMPFGILRCAWASHSDFNFRIRNLFCLLGDSGQTLLPLLSSIEA